MFIKLTRFDGRPVWLNAAFIVTVEPRRDGNGAIVVPIGDGLDYDVREKPEEVLRMLEGAPAPTVVPVPVSDGLAPTPSDVQPEPERPARKDPPAEPKKADAPPPKDGEAAGEAKPKKRTVRARKTTARKTKAAEPAAEKPAEPAKEPEPVKEPEPPKVELELSEAEIARLRKMAPKSIGKLKNTLATQFRIADVGANVSALVQKGVCTLDGNRVLWPVTEEAVTGNEGIVSP